MESTERGVQQGLRDAAAALVGADGEVVDVALGAVRDLEADGQPDQLVSGERQRGEGGGEGGAVDRQTGPFVVRTATGLDRGERVLADLVRRPRVLGRGRRGW
jgi:hypothetical protein